MYKYLQTHENLPYYPIGQNKKIQRVVLVKLLRLRPKNLIKIQIFTYSFNCPQLAEQCKLKLAFLSNRPHFKLCFKPLLVHIYYKLLNERIMFFLKIPIFFYLPLIH